MDERPATTDKIRAEVMTEVALHPGEMSRKSLAQRLSIDPTVIGRAVNALVERKWVIKRHDICSGKTGRPEVALLTSEAFNQVVDQVHLAASSLMTPDGLIYREAIQECRRAQSLPEDELAHYTARAFFLGGAALLAERVNPNDLTENLWFEGMPGWKALITIQALQQ